VFQTLRTNAVRAAALSVVLSSTLLPAGATSFQPSQTLRAGTKIACVLDEGVDSASLQSGAAFKLRVVDSNHPVLEGAEIHGIVTDVTQPSLLNPARIGFLLRTIHLRNGETKDIRAYVVNRGVVRYNPAAQRAVRQQLPPSVPYGTITPGPIAWQMRIGGGGQIAIGDKPEVAVGGYVYGSGPKRSIVVRAGTPVIVELANDLAIP